MKIDHVLTENAAGDSMPMTDGYDWIGIIDAARWPTLQQGTDLLIFQVQNHAGLFEQGGYIEDYDAVLFREMEALSYSSTHHKWDFDQAVIDHLKSAVPGFSQLDHRSDVSLLLSVYGKVCNALPGHARVNMHIAQLGETRGAKDFRRVRQPASGIVSRIKAAITKSPQENVEGLSSDTVAHAAISVVNEYANALEDGSMAMTAQRAMAIKWAMHSIKSAIEREFPTGWEPYDEPILIAIDKTMARFEDVLEARLDASVDHAGLIDDEIDAETPPGMSA